MTISIRTELAVSAKLDGYRYVRSSNVAVLSIIGTRSGQDTSLRSVTKECACHFEARLQSLFRKVPDACLLLFVATPPTHQSNVLVRRKGVWTSGGLQWLSEEARRSPSVEVSGANGLRFAGLAELRMADLFEALDLVRTQQSSFVLVSPDRDLTEARVRLMVAKLFPDGQAVVDWANAIDQICQREEICIRSIGGFDDQEVSIHAFFLSDLL